MTAGRPATSTDPRNIAKREKYANDPEFKAKFKAGVKKHQVRRKQEFDDWRNTRSCCRCGEFRGYVLEFHHVDPAGKDASPTNMWMGRWEAFCEEMEKCVIVCANCHKELHWLLQTDEDGYLAHAASLPRVVPPPRYTSR